MEGRMFRGRRAVALGLLALVVGLALAPAAGAQRREFKVEEATIADIQRAIQRRQVTTADVVNAYLERIKAYNGTCVDQPHGILGPISMVAHAGKVNALITLNLRPKNRLAWGFDERKARSMT